MRRRVNPFFGCYIHKQVTRTEARNSVHVHIQKHITSIDTIPHYVYISHPIFSTWVSESQSYFRLQFAENILAGEAIRVTITSGVCNPSCSSYLPHPELKLQVWTDGRTFHDFLLGKTGQNNTTWGEFSSAQAPVALTSMASTALQQHIDPNLLNDHVHVTHLRAGKKCGRIAIQFSCGSNFSIGDVLRVFFPGFSTDGSKDGLKLIETSETLRDQLHWDEATSCIDVRCARCTCSGTYRHWS